VLECCRQRKTRLFQLLSALMAAFTNPESSRGITDISTAATLLNTGTRRDWVVELDAKPIQALNVGREDDNGLGGTNSGSVERIERIVNIGFHAFLFFARLPRPSFVNGPPAWR